MRFPGYLNILNVPFAVLCAGPQPASSSAPARSMPPVAAAGPAPSRAGGPSAAGPSRKGAGLQQAPPAAVAASRGHTTGSGEPAADSGWQLVGLRGRGTTEPAAPPPPPYVDPWASDEEEGTKKVDEVDADLADDWEDAPAHLLGRGAKRNDGGALSGAENMWDALGS